MVWPHLMYTRDSMRSILLLLCACALARSPIDCAFYGTCPAPSEWRSEPSWSQYIYALYERLSYCHTNFRRYASHWQCLTGYHDTMVDHSFDPPRDNARLENDELDEVDEPCEQYVEPPIETIEEIPRECHMAAGSSTRTDCV
jgi:hypothetical protein